MRLSKRLFIRERKLIWAFASLLEQTKLIEEDGKRIVLKDYKKPGALFKWNILYLPPISIYFPLTNDPLERMLREERFFRNPPNNVRVPRIFSVDYRSLILKREVLDGKEPDLSSMNDIYGIGRVLSKIHRGEYCLGDTRPQNFLFMEDNGQEIGVIDAEQSVNNCKEIEYRMWDIIVFLFFIYLDNPLQDLKLFDEKVDNFLRGYVENDLSLDWKMMKQIHPLLLAFPLPYLQVIKKKVISYSLR